MKTSLLQKPILVLLLSILFLPVAQAQVFNGDLTLSSQAEVNSFNYTEITGSLDISGADITDLSPLSTLTTVGSGINIANNGALVTLNGLTSLSNVGSEFFIGNNPILSSIDGLTSLTSTASNFNISYNPVLSSLQGLNNLVSVGSILKIDDNPLLSDLSTFSSLTTVGSTFWIRDMVALTDLNDFSMLTSVGGTVTILSNTALTEFCALFPVINSGNFGAYNISGNAVNPTQQEIIDAGPCSVCPDGNTIFVNDDANGANTGLSWDDAYNDLQDALALADNCGDVTQIWVAAGTYYPTTGTDRNIPFVLKNNLAVYGGFAGDEMNLEDRDWETNVTILSGDLLGDDSPDFANNGDNSYSVVLTNTGTDASAILDGFTITAGNANAGGLIVPDSRGGGMYNDDSSSPTIANCIFDANAADYGAGVYNRFSSAPTLTNCRFINNSTPGWGGGMLTEEFSFPILNACTFSNNTALLGGAIIFLSASSTLTDCVFTENSTLADGAGGAVFENGTSNITYNSCEFNNNTSSFGGAICNSGTNVNAGTATYTLTNCNFNGNTSTGGGGAVAHGFSEANVSITFSNCSFIDNVAHDGSTIGTGGAFQSGGVGFNAEFTNCILNGNKALGDVDDGGGSIMIYAGTVSLINSTVTNSESASHGGAVNVFNSDGSIDIKNSILWNNIAVTDSNIYNGNGGTANAEYSLLQDDTCPANVTCGDGMIYNMDPLFADANDFHLQACSPAIDAGNNTGAPANDHDGNPRPFSPMGYDPATVDMGTYEFSTSMDICTECGPSVFAGNDANLIPGENYTLSDATAANYTSVSWASDGDGNFDDENALNPTYTPGLGDIAAGSVVLTLSAEGLSSCIFDSSDEMILSLNGPPTIQIISPMVGDVLYSNPVSVEGTAFDVDGNLAEVYLKVNDGDWILADGTDNWTGDLTLTPGENLISAKAVDALGLESDVAEVNVILSIQVIALSQGWSAISAFLTPNDPAMETVMQDMSVPENLIFMLGTTGIYWPGYGINTIGDWNVEEGYKVKLANADELIIRGDKLNDNSITFGPGFHIIPVLSNVPSQVNQIFADPQNDITYLFDINQGLAYWPEGGIFALQELLPGRGYMAQFKNEVTIDFPDYSGLKSASFTNPQQAQQTSPWEFTRTGNVHMISVDHEAAGLLKDVSYIGAFDAEGNCVGAAEINSSGGNHLLTVYADDETTTPKDGAKENEVLSFRAFNAFENSAYEIIPEFSMKMPDYSGTFRSNGLSSISGFKESSTGISDAGMLSQIRIYPNPAKEELNLSLAGFDPSDSGVAILLSSDGKLMKTISINNETSKVFVGDLPSGIYILKIETTEGVVVERVIVE